MHLTRDTTQRWPPENSGFHAQTKGAMTIRSGLLLVYSENSIITVEETYIAQAGETDVDELIRG